MSEDMINVMIDWSANYLAILSSIIKILECHCADCLSTDESKVKMNDRDAKDDKDKYLWEYEENVFSLSLYCNYFV